MTSARAGSDPRPFLYTRPLQPLGRLLIALLVLQLAANVVLIAAARRELTIFDQLRSNLSSVTQEDVDNADQLAGTTSFVLLLIFLATVVVFVVWLYRARRNVEQWSPVRQQLGPGWAIGAWFCPILNLWFPYRITRDVWDDTDGRARPNRPVLLAWWVSFVIAGPLTLLAVFIGAGDGHTRDEYSAVIIASALTIVSLLLAIAVVAGLSAAQTRRRALAYAATRA